MLSGNLRRSAGLAFILILLSAPLNRTSAQSLSLKGPATQTAFESTRAAVQMPRPRPRPQCNVKRRLLTGAAVGFLAGMLVIKEAAEANDGVADGKTTLGGGVYGSALGALIGLSTCRRP
jgi:hypothetical protein